MTRDENARSELTRGRDGGKGGGEEERKGSGEKYDAINESPSSLKVV